MQGGAQMGRIAPDRWEGRGERGEGVYRPTARRSVVEGTPV